MDFLEINSAVGIPLSDIQFTFVRSSGPGGQNVNKVASKAVLRWNLRKASGIPEDVARRFETLYPSAMTSDGEVVLTSQKTRDSIKNKADCLEKLQSMLRLAFKRPKPRIPTKPTRGSVLRRLENKNRLSRKKSERGKKYSQND